jgi:hypothetical protein
MQLETAGSGAVTSAPATSAQEPSSLNGTPPSHAADSDGSTDSEAQVGAGSC